MGLEDVSGQRYAPKLGIAFVYIDDEACLLHGRAFETDALDEAVVMPPMPDLDIDDSDASDGVSEDEL